MNRPILKNIAFSKRTAAYTALFAALSAFFLYLPALWNDFVLWDDDLNVYQNFNIRTFDFSMLRYAFTDTASGYWQPLTWISHAFDYALWGLNPSGYHLTNIILHSLNTFIVTMLFLLFLSDHVVRDTAKASENTFLSVFLPAATGGFFFGIHPLHVEPTAWITGRTDLLCTLFFLLGIAAYRQNIIFLNQKGFSSETLSISSRFHLLPFMFFLLACSSKPMAVSFPLVLILLDRHPFRRLETFKDLSIRIMEKIHFFCASAAVSAAAYLAEKNLGAVSELSSISLLDRILVAARAVTAYIEKILLPVHLSPLYPYPSEISSASFQYFLPVVVMLSISLLFAIFYKKYRTLAVIWFFFIATLLPVLGLVKARLFFMADRYAYLPTIPFFLAIGLFISKIREFRKSTMKWAIAASTGFIAISFIYLTVNQILVWKNSFTLWNYVIDIRGVQMSLAYNNRGSAYGENGQYEQAIEDFQKAIALAPTSPGLYNNIAVALENTGRLYEALSYYEKAIALDNRNYSYYHNRGIALSKTGAFDKAVDDYTKAIALNPYFADAYLSRGRAYQSLGNIQASMHDFRRACELGSREGCSAASALPHPLQ